MIPKSMEYYGYRTRDRTGSVFLRKQISFGRKIEFPMKKILHKYDNLLCKVD